MQIGGHNTETQTLTLVSISACIQHRNEIAMFKGSIYPIKILNLLHDLIGSATSMMAVS